MPWRHTFKNAFESRIMGWAVIVFVIVSLVLSIYVNEHARSYSHCVANWAHKNTARNNFLTPLVAKRDDALAKRNETLDALLTAAINRRTAEVRKLEPVYVANSQAYLKAQQTYTDALRTHPIPQSPTFTCH